MNFQKRREKQGSNFSNPVVEPVVGTKKIVGTKIVGTKKDGGAILVYLNLNKVLDLTMH